MSVHAFQAELSDGTVISLESFKGQALLIVNTASKCGLTPQYEGLEKLYNTYKDKGFTVLAFPCNQFGGQEPGTEEEIVHFCKTNYNVSFPIFRKIEVNGDNAHPLYQYLKKEAPREDAIDPDSRLYKRLSETPHLLDSPDIKWNFTKFLVDRNGRVVKRFAPTTKPEDIAAEIEQLVS